MKMKKFLTLLFACAFVYTTALPSYAVEGDLPSVSEQEENAPVQPEEDPSITIPEPDESSEPAQPDPDPDETPDPAPPDSVAPVEPGGETSGEAPVPDDTQDPVEGPGDDLKEDGEPGAEEEEPDGEGEEPEEENPEEEPAPEEESRIIDVVVPVSGRVVINPYRMKMATTYGETTDQVVHEPQVLISGSDFPVQVSAQVVGTLQPWSAARFVSVPPVEDAEDKEIFMYMEFQNDPTLWSGAYGDWPNQILVTDWGTEKENVMTLDAFGVGYFRLFGAMTNFPDAMWGEEDAPDVTVAFTFSPLTVQPGPVPFPEENFPAGEDPLAETMIPEDMEANYVW